MWPTMEVRWFYEGAIPGLVAEWFQRASGELEEPPPRIDYYLRLKDTDSLGVKLREGRIEIKQRYRQHGEIRLHARAAGVMEHWRKWSFELAGGGRRLDHLDAPASSWIKVWKDRQLRRYRVSSDGEVAHVSIGDYPDRGCSLELSTVNALGRGAWSLTFEAFGDESTLRENLLLVAGHAFSGDQPPVLEPGASSGYPRWLQTQEQGL